MARTGNPATTDRLVGPVNITIQPTWSVFFWAYFTAAPTGNQVEIAFHHAGGNFDLAYTQDHPSASFRNAWGWRNTAGTYYTAQISPGENRWRAIGCTFDGSSLRAYLDTNAAVSTSVSGSQDTGSQPMALLNNVNGSNVHGVPGSLAAPAYWRGVLQQGEFIEMARGRHPRSIRKTDQLIGPDLVGTGGAEPDAVLKRVWTTSGTISTFPSPKMWWPIVDRFTGTSPPPPPSTYQGARFQMPGIQVFTGRAA